MVIEINKDVDRYQESVAIPCVAPIALGGFYSFNGMNFYEYMGKKLHFMFGNRTLTYVSTEGELAVKEFEEMKKKTRNMLLGLAAVFVLVIAGAAVYKAMH